MLKRTSLVVCFLSLFCLGLIAGCQPAAEEVDVPAATDAAE